MNAFFLSTLALHSYFANAFPRVMKTVVQFSVSFSTGMGMNSMWDAA